MTLLVHPRHFSNVTEVFLLIQPHEGKMNSCVKLVGEIVKSGFRTLALSHTRTRAPLRRGFSQFFGQFHIEVGFIRRGMPLLALRSSRYARFFVGLMKCQITKLK